MDAVPSSIARPRRSPNFDTRLASHDWMKGEVSISVAVEHGDDRAASLASKVAARCTFINAQARPQLSFRRRWRRVTPSEGGAATLRRSSRCTSARRVRAAPLRRAPRSCHRPDRSRRPAGSAPAPGDVSDLSVCTRCPAPLSHRGDHRPPLMMRSSTRHLPLVLKQCGCLIYM